jgi:hypothetical protein
VCGSEGVCGQESVIVRLIFSKLVLPLVELWGLRSAGESDRYKFPKHTAKSAEPSRHSSMMTKLITLSHRRRSRRFDSCLAAGFGNGDFLPGGGGPSAVGGAQRRPHQGAGGEEPGVARAQGGGPIICSLWVQGLQPGS